MGGRKARRMDWGSAQASVSLIGAQKACAWYLLPTDVRTFFTDPTVIRHLFTTTIRLANNQLTAADYAAVGLIAWDGVTAATPNPCPGPLSDGNLDWIIRHVAPFSQFEPTASLRTFPNSDMLYQSKAQRRLGNTKGLLISWESTGGISPAFASDIRYLLKE